MKPITLALTAAATAAATGYPGVDSGAGGPLIHAKRTLSGFMGAVPGPTPPTVTVPAHAYFCNIQVHPVTSEP
jgi:hypothetical protein